MEHIHKSQHWDLSSLRMPSPERVPGLSRQLPFTGIVNVSNSRLFSVNEGNVSLAAGGLAAAMVPALSSLTEASAVIPLVQGEPSLAEILEGEIPFTLGEVALTPELYRLYYEGFSNSVLWPVLHGMRDFGASPQRGEWKAYKEVNQRFAEKIAGTATQDSLVWVHDYQLMLVPSSLRALKPEQAIGYFHHIPFPSPEQLTTFLSSTQTTELLQGLLGADLVGFHIEKYRRNFIAAVRKFVPSAQVLNGYQIAFGDRVTTLGDYPIGINSESISAIARSSEALEARSTLRAHLPQGKIFFGVSRLDYTKAIEYRFWAIPKLLEVRPELKGKFVLVQYAAPTRTGLPAYRRYRERVQAAADSVNNFCGTPDWKPIVFYPSHLDFPSVVGCYQEADAMVVAPRIDGMNLVVKEAIAARGHNPGVYILGRGAGAAVELKDAILVNGADPDSITTGFLEAFSLFEHPRERAHRHASLRRTVQASQVKSWRDSFIRDAALAVAKRTIPDAEAS